MAKHKHIHQKLNKASEDGVVKQRQAQQKSVSVNDIDVRHSESMPSNRLTNHVLAMQSLYGNSQTIQLLSRMPRMPSERVSNQKHLADSIVIQRKPPENVEDAMGISKAASKAFPTTKPRQSGDVFSSLRIQAQDGFDDLKSMIDKVASQTGGTASYRNKLKGMDRSWDKIVNKYDSDASGLIDIIAGKIVYDDFKGLYTAVDMLVNNSPVEIVYFADRFLAPVKSGYSDIIMSVKLRNGHIAEMRLHLASVDAIFEKEHRLYEIIRSKGYDALTDEQKEEYQKLKGEYDSARKAAFDSLG